MSKEKVIRDGRVNRAGHNYRNLQNWRPNDVTFHLRLCTNKLSNYVEIQHIAWFKYSNQLKISAWTDISSARHVWQIFTKEFVSVHVPLLPICHRWAPLKEPQTLCCAFTWHLLCNLWVPPAKKKNGHPWEPKLCSQRADYTAAVSKHIPSNLSAASCQFVHSCQQGVGTDVRGYSCYCHCLERKDCGY